jgi:molybdopterin-guanine dinucleotide biosynthesis protein A
MATGFSGIILAGGRSRRLGRDKASTPLLGVPLLQRTAARLADLVDEVVVVRRPGQPLPPVQIGSPVAVV